MRVCGVCAALSSAFVCTCEGIDTCFVRGANAALVTKPLSQFRARPLTLGLRLTLLVSHATTIIPDLVIPALPLLP